MLRRIAGAVLALVFVCTIAACGQSLTMEKYQQISTGMTLEQVEAILGKGEEQASSGVDMPDMPGMSGGSMTSQTYAWQSGTRVVTISFMNGKVVAKAQAGL